MVNGSVELVRNTLSLIHSGARAVIRYFGKANGITSVLFLNTPFPFFLFPNLGVKKSHLSDNQG